MKKRVLIFLVFLCSLFFIKRTYCDELTKEVEFKKDYSFCTFTVSGDNLESCTGYVISPNGGTYALSYIDGYMVATIQKVDAGTWTVKIVSEVEGEVPSFKVSVSSSSLVSQGKDVVDTSIAKKVTGLKAYMEDDYINVSWKKEDNESVLIDICDADTLESLDSVSNADGKARYTVPSEAKRVIVKCVYYRYREYDNAYTSYVFDKSDLPTAEISFNCKEKTNLNTVECTVNTEHSYVVYNNGTAVSGSIPFEEGLNHVVVRLTSDKGYIKNYEYNFTKDTKPPVLSLNSDFNLMSTTHEQMQISGSVTDAVSLMIQGNYVQFNDEGYFEAILNFNLGDNEIVIKATDDTGNVTEYIAYVTRYEEEKKFNPTLLVIILSVLVIAGLIFFGKKWFKRNLREELKKAEEENESVKQELEQERYKATHDELTKCKNRTGYMQDLKDIDIADVCIINFDVNNLKWTNDNLGHQSGDKLLLTISDLLNEKFDNVYRMGGDEFSVLTNKYTFDDEVLTEIDEILAKKTKNDVNNIIYQVAYGYDFGDGIKTEKEISYNADQLMYEDKRLKKERLKDEKERLVESGFSLEAIDNLLKKHDRKVEVENLKKQDRKSLKAEIKEEVKKLDKVDKKKFMFLSLITYLPYLVLLIAIYVLMNHVFFVGNIVSDSMSPTMKTGDMIIGSRLYYSNNDYECGDKIFFKKDGKYLGKRVIGLSGDTITFKNGYVVINGEVTKEEYLNEDIETIGVKTYDVPENGLFVLGDNRASSLDSRYWDNPYLSKSDVVGKIFIVVPQKYAVVLKYMLCALGLILITIFIVSEIFNRRNQKGEP